MNGANAMMKTRAFTSDRSSIFLDLNCIEFSHISYVFIQDFINFLYQKKCFLRRCKAMLKYNVYSCTHFYEIDS